MPLTIPERTSAAPAWSRRSHRGVSGPTARSGPACTASPPDSRPVPATRRDAQSPRRMFRRPTPACPSTRPPARRCSTTPRGSGRRSSPLPLSPDGVSPYHRTRRNWIVVRRATRRRRRRQFRGRRTPYDRTRQRSPSTGSLLPVNPLGRRRAAPWWRGEWRARRRIHVRPWNAIGTFTLRLETNFTERAPVAVPQRCCRCGTISAKLSNGSRKSSMKPCGKCSA